jgi:hypothetical protein
MKRIICLGFIILMFCWQISACGSVRKPPVQKSWRRVVPFQGTTISFNGMKSSDPKSCQVRSVDLIGAWVTANTPEKDAFPFNDINGKPCQGTFAADVLPLFSQANLWYSGALSCRTCHGPDIPNSYARLDMSTYLGILAGSGRDSADTKGDDILGGGNWEQAELYNQLVNGDMPPNRPSTVHPKGPVIHAGNLQ